MSHSDAVALHGGRLNAITVHSSLLSNAEKEKVRVGGVEGSLLCTGDADRFYTEALNMDGFIGILIRYMNTTTGEWLPDELEIWMENIINASTAGKSVVLHFNPGPSFPPFTNYPINGTPGNQFIAPTWVGPEKLPTTAAGIRQAAADALVTSLAPFLIVANEHVFLQYAWFYEVQDGNIPCPSYIECGMPETWYPEFSKPLGPPTGPAAHNGYIWTREFAHASVYVDVRTRHSSKITWH